MGLLVRVSLTDASGKNPNKYVRQMYCSHHFLLLYPLLSSQKSYLFAFFQTQGYEGTSGHDASCREIALGEPISHTILHINWKPYNQVNQALSSPACSKLLHSGVAHLSHQQPGEQFLSYFTNSIFSGLFFPRPLSPGSQNIHPSPLSLEFC